MVLAILVANASTWKVYNYFVTQKIQNLYDTGDKVYYLNSGFLFQYDKASKQTDALLRQNILSDTGPINQIFYDWEHRLLFVAYANSNIDIIDDNGKVTNISNVKDTAMPTATYTIFIDPEKDNGILTSWVGKTINDITFSNGIAYVAAGYGYLTIDESTLTVIENHNMGTNICVNSVAVVGDKMIMLTNSNCYYGDPHSKNPRNEFARKSGSLTGAKIYPIDDHSFLVYGCGNFYRYDFSSGSMVVTTLVSAKATSVQKTPTGFVANFLGQAYYYTLDATGLTATKASTVVGFASSHPQGDGTLWICDANGLHVKGSTTYYKLNSMTTDEPYWLKYNAAMDKLYVGVSGPNMTSTSNMSISNVINTFDGTQWRNATAYTAAGAGYAFEFSPVDPTTYVRAGWATGIFKVTNDVMKLNYKKANSNFVRYKPTPAFDNYGNLWVVCSYHNPDGTEDHLPYVQVLTADKFTKNSVTPSDWFVPTGFNFNKKTTIQRSRFLISKKNNLKIFTDGDFLSKGDYTGELLCWDNGSEDPTVDNYKLVKISSFTDQNGKLVDWVYLSHLEEDKDGLVWVGHTLGLFVVDPAGLFDEHPRAYRPFAKSIKGNLCEGYSVYDIAVDRENKKWIATDDGLYYVSPDGTVIYDHFTVENSDLPSNTVYSVECDTVHDRVYIFTNNGFAEYLDEGEAPALNFDNMYAFPNPVEPDFTGMIKIENLMAAAYVTITDRDGNIVRQMGPVRGCAYWEGSGADGERVATGIYNIYAAQGHQPAITGAPQATVMIIK